MARETPEETQKQLLLLLEEAKNRGLRLPKEITQKKIIKFSTDSRGYFTKIDGGFYNATEQQEGFILSPARFVGYGGSRGCISAETLLGGIPVGDMHSNFVVSSMFGDTPANKPFIKGKANLYRLKTLAGAAVVATDKHRILTLDGWIPLSQVQSHSLVLIDETSNENLRMELLPSYLDCYSNYFRLSGVLYDLSERVVLNILHRLHMPAYENNAWLDFFLLSIGDFLSRMLFISYVEHLISLKVYGYNQLMFRTSFLSLCNYLLEDIDLLLRPLEDDTFLVLYDDHTKYHTQMLCEKLNDEINSIREKFEAESFHPLLKQLFEILLGRYHISPEYFVFSCQYELQKKFQEISFCETMWMDEKFQICGKSPQDFHIDGNSQLLRPNLNSHIFQLSCAELISISKLLKSYELLLHSNSSFCLSDVYQDLVGYTSQLLHNLFVLDDQLSLDIPPNPTNYSALFDEVESIKYEKYGEFYDLEVPNIHHYSAQGLFHHNSGKSSAGAQKALRKIMLGESGAVMNADFENLKTSTWAEFREWIPWDMVVPAHRYRKNIEFDPHQQFRLAFLNGATVVIKGVKDPSAARGANINWLWYDEAQRDDTGLSWQIAIASVRVGKDPQAWATFTPSSQGKDFWGYKFFVQQDISQEALELFEKDGGGRPLVEFFKGTIYDNQDNLDPGFMASLLALYAEGGLRQREVLGEFVGDESYLGDRRWFDNKVIYALPENLVKKVRYWDLAATEKKITGKKSNDPDESVGTRMSWNKLDFYIEDQVAGCWKWDDLKEKIYETAEKDGEYVQVFLEEEPGSGGKNQIAELTKFLRERLPNHSTAIGWRPPTDRLTCANTWFAEAKAGHVYLLYGDWNELFLNQFSCFPGCRHDDKITSVSGARYNLAPIKTWVTMKFLHL